MKLFCLWAFFCCCQVLEAQQKKVDSLWKELKAHPLEDTVRLNILISLTSAYQTENPDSGLIMGDAAINLSKRLSRPDKLASALTNKAWSYSSKGQDSAALATFGQSLAIRTELKDEAGIARTRYNMGVIYFNFSEYPNGLDHLQAALAYFLQVGDSLKAAHCYNSIGLVYQYVTDFPKALENFLKAMYIYEHSTNKYGLDAVLTNIGLFYKKTGQLDKALQYQQKALALYEHNGDKQGMANCLGNVGIIYDEMNQPGRSLIYYQQALHLCRSIGFQGGIATNLANIGTIYMELSNYSGALRYLQQARKICELSGDKDRVAEVLGETAKAYANAPDTALVKMGIRPGRQYARAISLLDSSLKIAKEIHSLERQQIGWQYLQEIREKQKDFAGALTAYKQVVLLSDSISNTEKTREMTRREMQFDFEKKESLLQAEHDKQQALAAAEIRRQRFVRNAILLGSVFSLLAALLIFILYKKRRDAKYRQKEAEFKAQTADTEMKALRAQMNPHFIFNSLNSISDFITRNDIKQADFYLVRFARLMRLILENSESKEVSLANDLKALDIYIQLEKLRLDQAFSYEIRVDQQLDQDLVLVPPLILQPFVENSIWHGVSGRRGTGQILIDIRKEDEMINCIVEDNGVGRKKENGTTSKSLGIKITTARINIINKLKNSHASLAITDLEEGVRVEVRLPLEYRF